MSLMTLGSSPAWVTNLAPAVEPGIAAASSVPAPADTGGLPALDNALATLRQVSAIAAAAPTPAPATTITTASMTGGLALQPNLLWLGAAGVALVAGIIYWRRSH